MSFLTHQVHHQVEHQLEINNHTEHFYLLYIKFAHYESVNNKNKTSLLIEQLFDFSINKKMNNSTLI